MPPAKLIWKVQSFMRKSFVLLLVAAISLHAQSAPLVIEHGTYSVHLLLHTIGTEEYSVTDLGAGGRVLTTSFRTDDRGTIGRSGEAWGSLLVAGS